MEEIKEITKQYFDAQGIDFQSEQLTNYFIESFCEEKIASSNQLQTIHINRNGSKSRKTKNLILNWKRLMFIGMEGTLSIVGASHNKWLLPMAGLLVCRQIWAALEVKVDQQDATVLWAMWQLKKENSLLIPKENLYSRINNLLPLEEETTLSEKEFKKSLSTLKNLYCLNEEDDFFHLKEKVLKKY